jgi:hypothetical protein
MRKVSIACVFAVAAVLSSSGFCYAATNRAVSLRVLESVAKSGRSRDAQTLCGITKMSGYITDKRTHDIILFGEVDPTYPALHLDDFVVAMRSVNMAYAQKKGRTYYYSPPGCSIDPNPKVLRRLQQIGNEMTGSPSPEERQQRLDDWKAVAASPQTVRVMGVPFDTRFAKVMVDADYYMKRLVNGSVNLGIPGFMGLMDMDIGLARKSMKTGKMPPPASSMSRFWFCPGETAFEEDDGVVTLKSCRVKLLTEQEFLTVNGAIAGAGRPDPLAKQFADGFTVYYDRIAAARPIYKELQGLFRFVALAKLLREGNEFAAVGADLGYLRSRYRINVSPVSRAVQGLTRSAELNEDRETPDGKAVMRQTFLCCGGVSMDVRPRRIKTARYVSKVRAKGSAKAKVTAVRRTSKVKHEVLTARKSPNALYWDFPKTP